MGEPTISTCVFLQTKAKNPAILSSSTGPFVPISVSAGQSLLQITLMHGRPPEWTLVRSTTKSWQPKAWAVADLLRSLFCKCDRILKENRKLIWRSGGGLMKELSFSFLSFFHENRIGRWNSGFRFLVENTDFHSLILY
jgi:hypothetical protein